MSRKRARPVCVGLLVRITRLRRVMRARPTNADTTAAPPLQRLARGRSGVRLNERIEPVEIDRLDQMMLEAAIVASSNVFLHPEAGQRDSEDRPRFAQALHQI